MFIVANEWQAALLVVVLLILIYEAWKDWRKP